MTRKAKGKRTKLFTVIGYMDGDYGVETFVHHVKAHDGGDAWDQAMKKVRTDCEEGAHHRCDPDNATEITTLAGWQVDAHGAAA